jgi:hypothetical protein
MCAFFAHQSYGYSMQLVVRQLEQPAGSRTVADVTYLK